MYLPCTRYIPFIEYIASIFLPFFTFYFYFYQIAIFRNYFESNLYVLFTLYIASTLYHIRYKDELAIRKGIP